MPGPAVADDDEEEDDDEQEEEEIGAGRAPGPKEQGMAYTSPTVSSSRMQALYLEQVRRRREEEQTKQAADPGLRERGGAEALRRMLRHRFGSCAAGWRAALDPKNAHRIGKVEFFKLMRTFGLSGDVRAAWDELSLGRDQVTLADVDPKAAQMLSEFYATFTSVVGPLQDLLCNACSLRISQPHFLDCCKPLVLHWKEEETKPPFRLEAVFANLQTGDGSVTAADCQWLQHYCERDTRQPASSSTAPKIQYAEVKRPATLKRAVEEFRALLHHRYGSAIRGWRYVLDKETTGELTHDAFMEAAKQVGFKGDLEHVWDGLVTGSRQVLKLEDLEPSAPRVLQGLLRGCVDRFGSVSAAFIELESATKPLVLHDDFIRFCHEVRLDANHRMLFEYLDKRHAGAVLLEDVDFDAAMAVFGDIVCKDAMRQLKKMKRIPLQPQHVTLQSRAAAQCGAHKREPENVPSERKALLEHLQQRFGSPVRGWKMALDPLGKGKLTRDDFLTACSTAGFSGNKTKLWEELKLKPNAVVRLKDIAPEVMEEFATFNKSVGDRLASIIQAAKTDNPKTRKTACIEGWEFQEMCKNLRYKGDPLHLATYLDLNGDGTVGLRTLQWLSDHRDEKAIPSLLKKDAVAKKKQWKDKLAAVVVPSMQKVTAQQEELLKVGRESRAARQELETAKQELLTTLSTKFGSVARAWHVVLDPKKRGEVKSVAFTAALKKIGFLGPEPGPEESQKASRLFEFLKDKENNSVRLQDLDPLTQASLKLLKERLVLRFGSIEQGFVEFDPEGTGSVNAQAFKLLCQTVKVTDGIRRMLDFLDPNSEGKIKLKDIDRDGAENALAASQSRKDLEARRRARAKRKGRAPEAPPLEGPALWKKERELAFGMKGLKDFKARLRGSYGSLVAAWRSLLNPKGKKRISLRVFTAACQKVGVQIDPNLIWEAMGAKDDLSLLQFDPGTTSDLRDLRARMVTRYGSIDNAFDDVDTDGSFELDWAGFKNLCFECQFRGNERRLFEYLDAASENVVSLGRLDRRAVECVRERREAEEERRAQEGTGRQPPATKELAEGASETSTETAGAAQGVPRRDPARSFRAMTASRFGSVVGAWRALDWDGYGALTKSEFLQSVRLTGYAGNPVLLWKSLVGEEDAKALFSIRELDPEVFRQLAAFRKGCVRRFKSLRKAFTDSGGQLTRRFTEPEFIKLCKQVHCPKPWRRVFEQLDARGTETVTWEDVLFLEQDWEWEGDKAKPVRRAGVPRAGRLPAAPSPPAAPRAAGSGPLCTSMRPRQVSLRKSSSLPAISNIRAQWNDRHHVNDHLGNKDMQLIHLVTRVLTQDQERLRERIAKEVSEVPVHDWVRENLLMA